MSARGHHNAAAKLGGDGPRRRGIHSGAAYDAAGQKTADTDETGHSQRYAYDSAARLIQTTQPSGAATRYEWNEAGQLLSQTDALGRTAHYGYDLGGRRTSRRLPDGSQETNTHDADGRLVQKRQTDGATISYSHSQGRATGQTRPDGTTPSATIRYTWSSDNRLLKASDGSTSIRYGYDALGRRISRTQETGGQKQETQWILDTARPYSEIVLERSRQNGGAWQETRYTHTPDGVGQLINEQRQGKTLHVYEDGQGSARLITDEGSQIIETLDFDAFGNEPNPDPASPTRHRYTGESYDSATGLYHLRARDYDPKTGRFISMDKHPGSQSIPLTQNKYLYGNADPVNHIDSSGNFGLIGVSIGSNIQSVLGNLQADFGFNLVGNALNGGESESASSMGWAVLASMAPFSVSKLSKGAVRLSTKMGAVGRWHIHLQKNH